MIRRDKVSIDYNREVGSEDDGDYREEEFQISGTAYYDPGKYSGLYENCYPAESEANITQILRRVGNKWEKVSTEVFTSEEMEEIENLMIGELSDRD
jgi:hypothetical protein